jgi:hypothetical protein
LTDLIAVKVIEKGTTQPLPSTEVKNAQSPEQEFLSTDEALCLLKIKSKVTLRSYVQAGLIPKPKRVGGRKLIYKKSDLLKYLGDDK